MNYKITISRKEPNPNYAAEVAKWQERNNRFNRNDPYDEREPQPETITNALICELTEEQFKAVKAAVFKSFE